MAIFNSYVKLPEGTSYQNSTSEPHIKCGLPWLPRCYEEKTSETHLPPKSSHVLQVPVRPGVLLSYRVSPLIGSPLENSLTDFEEVCIGETNILYITFW